jgi:hypothetical protein
VAAARRHRRMGGKPWAPPGHALPLGAAPAPPSFLLPPFCPSWPRASHSDCRSRLLSSTAAPPSANATVPAQRPDLPPIHLATCSATSSSPPNGPPCALLVDGKAQSSFFLHAPPWSGRRARTPPPAPSLSLSPLASHYRVRHPFVETMHTLDSRSGPGVGRWPTVTAALPRRWGRRHPVATPRSPPICSLGQVGLGPRH